MVENNKMIISNETFCVIFKQYAFAKKGKIWQDSCRICRK